MEVVTGKSISGQIAFGRLRFVQRRLPELAEFSSLSWQEEQRRFHQAQQRAVNQLVERHGRALNQVGEGISAVFSIHAILLADSDFVGTIEDMIREKGVTAEYAVWAVGEELGSAFSDMESAYMRARAVDIRDIAYQVMRLLLEYSPENPLQQGPAILVANEFLPSEVLDLDHRRLLGIISRKGNVESHAALLLRAYGIPAMAEVSLERKWDGYPALLDGFAHRLYLDPDQSVINALRLRYQKGQPILQG